MGCDADDDFFGIFEKNRTEANSWARFELDLKTGLRLNWKKAEIGLMGWGGLSAVKFLFSDVFALVFSISVCLD